ncbi:MAG: hypothetical protein ACR2PL_21870 [Dehalococcoidia bacterium]
MPIEVAVCQCPRCQQADTTVAIIAGLAGAPRQPAVSINTILAIMARMCPCETSAYRGPRPLPACRDLAVGSGRWSTRPPWWGIVRHAVRLSKATCDLTRKGERAKHSGAVQ